MENSSSLYKVHYIRRKSNVLRHHSSLQLKLQSNPFNFLGHSFIYTNIFVTQNRPFGRILIAFSQLVPFTPILQSWHKDNILIYEKQFPTLLNPYGLFYKTTPSIFQPPYISMVTPLLTINPETNLPKNIKTNEFLPQGEHVGNSSHQFSCCQEKDIEMNPFCSPLRNTEIFYPFIQFCLVLNVNHTKALLYSQGSSINN